MPDNVSRTVNAVTGEAKTIRRGRDIRMYDDEEVGRDLARMESPPEHNELPMLGKISYLILIFVIPVVGVWLFQR